MTLTDPGAVISAPPDVCTQEGPHVVHCRSRPDRFGFPGYLSKLTAALGDLDDEIRIGDLGSSSHEVNASGGSGDDRLFGNRDTERYDGGAGDDVLYGSFSADVLTGGGGRDELYGQEGSDLLADGDREGSGVGPDLLDGGPEHDTVTYASRRSPVFVDLDDERPDGARGERDILRRLEGAIGGARNDRLAGENRSRVGLYGPHGSFLDGGPGRDTLTGRGGDDQLLPGKDGARVSCGTGADVVMERSYNAGAHEPARITAKSRLGPDCEQFQATSRVGLWPDLPVNPSVTRSRSVTYEVSCPLGGAYLDEREACSGRLRLVERSEPHRLLARGRFTRGHWEGKAVNLRFTARGRALVAGGGGWATMRTTGRNYPARNWTLRLPGG